MYLSNPDILLFCVSSAADLQFFIQSLKDINWMPKMVATVASSSFLGLNPEDIQYFISLTDWSVCMHLKGVPIWDTPTNFSRQFEAEIGHPAPRSAAVAVASLTIFQNALEIYFFQRLRNQLPLTKPSLDDLNFYLSRVSLKTIIGDVRFNAILGSIGSSILFQNIPSNCPCISSSQYPDFDLLLDHSYPNSTVASVLIPIFAPLYQRSRIVYPATPWDERVYNPEYCAKPSEQAITIIMAILCFGYLCWMTFICVYWNNDSIRYATPVFLLIMLFGAIVASTSVVTWMIYVTDASCQAFPWLLTLGFCLFIMSIILKNYRVYLLSSASQRMMFTYVPLSVMFTGFTAILIPALILLIVWQAYSPLVAVTHVPDIFNPSKNYTTCVADSSSQVFIGILLAYCGSFVLLSMLLSFKTWKIDRAVLNEGAPIALGSYTLAVSGIIAIVLSATSAVSLEVSFIIRSICILFGIASSVYILLIPKVFHIRSGKSFSKALSSTTLGGSFSHTSISTVNS